MTAGFSIKTLLAIAIIALAVFGAIRGIITIVRSIKTLKGESDRALTRWYWAFIICVIAMVILWVFNMGWYRVILTWLAVPIMHAAIFLWANFKAAAQISRFKSLKILVVISCITFLLPYFIFPDGGDTGEMYFFFTIVKNDQAVKVMLTLAPVMLAINILVLVIENIVVKRCKKISE